MFTQILRLPWIDPLALKALSLKMVDKLANRIDSLVHVI